MNRYTTGQTLKATREINYPKGNVNHTIKEGEQVTYITDCKGEPMGFNHAVMHTSADGEATVFVDDDEVSAA